MAKAAVIYATKTKHSKKLAEAIGAALQVEAKNISRNPALTDVDLLFIVSGIYAGASKPELLDYLKRLEAPLPMSAAIVTSCASGKQNQTAVRDVLEEKGIKVIDEFVCRGSFLFASINHPNAKDLTAATDFAERIFSEMTK